MQHFAPNYYAQFTCIAGACRHNCCIGWEIDIDEDTLAYYQGYSGPMTNRLRANIDLNADPPHFILGHSERCPFLNKDNLCDIIIEMGENHICQICTDHPRFHNELPGRIESGLGLCCEEAARLILGQTDPVTYLLTDTASDTSMPFADEEEDEIISYRDEVLTQLQLRNLSIDQRIELLHLPLSIELPEWIPFLLDLEILDPAWPKLLTHLSQNFDQIDWSGFSDHMKHRQTEYEQLLVYLIYRHTANAPSLEDADARVLFAVLGFCLIHALGAAAFTLRGDFTFEDQVELTRLFSSEIEYCEDNLYAILDELYESMEF